MCVKLPSLVRPDQESPVHIGTTCCFRLHTLACPHQIEHESRRRVCVPAHQHLGCNGMAGGIPGTTEAVGQRCPQCSLCCRHISAADAAAVLAADANPSALPSTPYSGQCGVLQLLQHMAFTLCWVMHAWQLWPAALGQKQRHTGAAQQFS